MNVELKEVLHSAFMALPQRLGDVAKGVRSIELRCSAK